MEDRPSRVKRVLSTHASARRTRTRRSRVDIRYERIGDRDAARGARRVRPGVVQGRRRSGRKVEGPERLGERESGDAPARARASTARADAAPSPRKRTVRAISAETGGNPSPDSPASPRPVDPRPRTSPPSRVGARSSTIPNIRARRRRPSRASRNQRTNSRRRLLTRRPRVETQRFSGTKRLRTQRRFRLHPQLLLEVRALSPSRPSSRVARLHLARLFPP